MTPRDTAGLKCPPLQPRGGGSLEVRSKAHREVRLYTSLSLKLGLQAGPSEPCCKQKCSKSPIFPEEPCGGTGAQRELGMSGQTPGGLGDKHIGRTSMNPPRPLRAGPSPPETGPGSTPAHHTADCRTKMLACVQHASLPASHTRGFTEPSSCHLLWLAHRLGGSPFHPARKPQGPPRWVTSLPSLPQPPLDI